MNDYFAGRLHFWSAWFGTLAMLGWIVVIGIAFTHRTDLMVPENLAAFAFLVAIVLAITVVVLLIRSSVARRSAS